MLLDKLKTLQAELTNSESVQKDFVKLSQQLQVSVALIIYFALSLVSHHLLVAVNINY